MAGITVGMFAVVCALLWFSLKDAPSRSPLINGKPVAYWTRQLGRMDQDAAISALRSEMGTTIPALVKQLSLPDVAAKDFAKRLWLRLPSMLQDRVREPTTGADLRAEALVALDMIYGPDSGASLSEAQMILPALAKTLQDRDLAVRVFAANALGRLEAISAQAIEACEVALKDPHPAVRSYAVSSLSSLARRDKRAIPLLRSALSDSHTRIREEVAEQLEQLGITPRHDDASSATETK